MTELFILLSDMAAGCVRVTVCLFLVCRLLSAEKLGKVSMAAAPGVAAAVSLFLSVAGLPEFYRMALEAALIAVCGGRLLKASARMSLFVGIFYEIGVGFWQFLFAAWSGVLFRSPSFLDHGTGEGQLAVWLFHGLLAALAFYVFRGQGITGKGAFRSASGIVAAGVFAVVSLSQQQVLTIADDTLDMWTILAVVLMMAVLVFNMNRQYEVERQLAELKSQQAELLERDYTALSNSYAVNAKLFHDFHNHIGVLRQLLSHEKTEEAVCYLDGLQTPVREMTDTLWTGDETVDYLINSKAAIAARDGIRLEAQVEFPRHTNLRSADLCAILGNLLDNALEASRQTPEPDERFIRLTIRRIHQMLVIKVENSFAIPPVEEGSSLKTTKEEAGLHGWGLKSVRTAAEKYDGTVQTSFAGNIFRAVVTLSWQGVLRESNTPL